MNDFSVHITNRLELFLTSLLCWRKTWLAGLQLKEDVSSSPSQQVPHTHTHEYTQFHIRKHVQSHIPNGCALTYKQVQYRHTNKLNFIFINMFIFIVPQFYVCTHTRNLNHVLVLILLLLILILPPTRCIFFDAARSYFCSQLAERMLHCFRPSCSSCNSWSSGAFGGLRPLRTWRLPGLWEIWLLPLFALPCLISSPFICRRPDWEKEEQTRFVLGEFPEHVRMGIEKE